MSIEIEKLTQRDIKNFKRDIEKYRKTQGLFLILGFIFLGIFLITLALGVVMTVLFIQNIDKQQLYFLYISLMDTGYSIAALFFVGMLAMFVLRGALFNGKIDNRQRAIEDWEDLQKSNQITTVE